MNGIVNYIKSSNNTVSLELIKKCQWLFSILNITEEIGCKMSLKRFGGLAVTALIGNIKIK